MRLLVAERSPESASRLCAVLDQRFGARAHIEATTSAVEAVELAERDRCNFVLANIRLGQGNGLDLCKALRARPALADIPIMLLGEHVAVRDKIDGFINGADDFVVQPIDDRLLTARVELLWRIKGLGRMRSPGPSSSG